MLVQNNVDLKFRIYIYIYIFCILLMQITGNYYFVNNRTKSKYTCINNVISIFLQHLSITHLELKHELNKISIISIILIILIIRTHTKVQTVLTIST